MEIKYKLFIKCPFLILIFDIVNKIGPIWYEFGSKTLNIEKIPLSKIRELSKNVKILKISFIYTWMLARSEQSNKQNKQTQDMQYISNLCKTRVRSENIIFKSDDDQKITQMKLISCIDPCKN